MSLDVQEAGPAAQPWRGAAMARAHDLVRAAPAADPAPPHAGGLSRLPREVLAALFFRIEAPADARALSLVCRDAAGAWALARAAWVLHRRREAAFVRACAANNGDAAAELLDLGWPGAPAAAAAAAARHARAGDAAAVAAIVAWAARAAPALLAPPSGANGPLVVAAAAGRAAMAHATARALLSLLPRARGAAAAAAAAAGVRPAHVQAQLDSALCVAAAGGQTAIMAALLDLGADAGGGGGGGGAGGAAPGAGGVGAAAAPQRGALHVAVLHRQAAAVALLAARRAPDGGPTPRQAAAAAELAASSGHACCLRALLDSGLLPPPALRGALVAAVRAERRECAALALACMRRSAAARRPARAGGGCGAGGSSPRAMGELGGGDGACTVCVVRVSGAAPPPGKAAPPAPPPPSPGLKIGAQGASAALRAALLESLAVAAPGSVTAAMLLREAVAMGAAAPPPPRAAATPAAAAAAAAQRGAEGLQHKCWLRRLAPAGVKSHGSAPALCGASEGGGLAEPDASNSSGSARSSCELPPRVARGSKAAAAAAAAAGLLPAAPPASAFANAISDSLVQLLGAVGAAPPSRRGGASALSPRHTYSCSSLSSICSASPLSAPLPSGRPPLCGAPPGGAPGGGLPPAGGSVCSTASSGGAAGRGGPCAIEAQGSALSVSSVGPGDAAPSLSGSEGSEGAAAAASAASGVRSTPLLCADTLPVGKLEDMISCHMRLLQGPTSHPVPASAPRGGAAAPPGAGPPCASPGKARLLAQLQRRQRQRELEAEALEEALGGGGGGGGIKAWGAAPAAPPARAAEGLVLVSAAAMIPHIAKARTGGEDAFFISDAGHGALGVSDGVSAWADDGVDPGEYSRTLVRNLRDAVEAAPPGPAGPFEGRALLRRAQMTTLKPGSATVVLAALRPRGGGPPPRGGGGGGGGSGSGDDDASDWGGDGGGGEDASTSSGGALSSSNGSAGGGGGGGGAYDLHISNLGDCGVRVIRNGEIVLATQPQQHDFNLPFQLSHPRLFPETDIADSADRYVLEVEDGDIVIAASDGLFDNMWDDQLLQVVSEALGTRRPAPLLPLAAAAAARAPRGGRKRDRGPLARGGAAGDAAAEPQPASPAASDAGFFSKPRHRRGIGALRSFGSWGQLRAAAAAAQRQQAAAAAAAAGPPPPKAAGAGGGGGGVRDRMARAMSTPNFSRFAAAPSPPEPGSPREPPRAPIDPSTLGPAALAQRAADMLARAAFVNASDDHFRSPWAAAAGRQGLIARLFARGGKMDDCTCVVAIVRDAAAARAAVGAGAAAGAAPGGAAAAEGGAEP
ncbi:MAG: hypothetical protein J3K34DRAFT_460248 [Monoraphidium minutum]|nr:MAG: hypothetical protein J3K34DRAFT_460248 [Monoraphidium minutum]